MLWIHLSIFRSIIVALLILSLRYDSTPYFMLPIIVNVIVGVISILYFIFYYTEHFSNEFVKPTYYLYAIVFLLMNLLGFYIIKVCPRIFQGFHFATNHTAIPHHALCNGKRKRRFRGIHTVDGGIAIRLPRNHTDIPR